MGRIVRSVGSVAAAQLDISLLKKSGSGPIFGATTSFFRESLAENLDLTPSFHFFNRLMSEGLTASG